MRKAVLASLLVAAFVGAGWAQRPTRPAKAPARAQVARLGIALSPQEKKWLEEDVVHIIAGRERAVFLALDSHELRDRFIAEFWRQRDPSPGSEENEFREEHYRRIAYADDMFGARSLKDGWRTERGRVYILFGEPQAKQSWTNTPGLKNIEMWFYEAPRKMHRTAAFFRVVFYRRDLGKDYQLYDPTVDGPEELVEGPHMIAPTREAALAYIQRVAGPELWHVAQTLIPSEPTGVGFSGQSQALRAAIEDYRNAAIDSSYAEMFLATRGHVATRLTFKHIPLRFLPAVLYNPRREAFLHAAFEVAPENLRAAKLDTGRVYVGLTVKTFVNELETNKNLLERSDHLVFDFNERDGKVLARPVAFQQVLPLVPGKFKLGWIIEDEVGGQFTWHSHMAEVAVADLPRAKLTPPLVAGAHQVLAPAQANQLHPFRIANVQYLIRAARLYNLGDDPAVFFEYLYPVSAGKPQVGDVQFTIVVRKTAGMAPPGKPGASPIEVVRITHSIPRDRLPASGFVSLHRQIPRDKLEAGEYEVVVRAEESSSAETAEERARFSFRGADPLAGPVLREVPPQPSEFGEGYILERLRQYRALKRNKEAIHEAEAALARTGVESTSILNALAELYAEAGDRRKALDALQRSLARDPSQAEVRARIETFGTQPSP